MKRISLVQHGAYKITPDTDKAVRLLIERAKHHGWLVGLKDVPKKTGLYAAGREVCFEIRLRESEWKAETQDAINALWGLAIPLGLTPLARYPFPDPDAYIFHYFGVWESLKDRILAEGRGHKMWDCLVCASLSDLGQWSGGKGLVRFIQSQLHRIGYNCGVIDGVVGSRTLRCLEAANMTGIPLEEIASLLCEKDRIVRKSAKGFKKGFISLPDQNFNVVCYGSVRTVKTPNGVSIENNGTGGRIILDLVGAET